MRLLDTVILIGLHTETLLGMHVADDTYKDFQCSEMVVTSVTDGRHSVTSLHKVGYAFDVRLPQRCSHSRERVIEILRNRLTPEFDVVVEATHIHVEYQPKYDQN
jgi:hypothetical protein